MSSFIYANWRKNMGAKLEQFGTYLNGAGDAFRAALFGTSYVPSQNTDQAYGTLSGGTWYGLGPPSFSNANLSQAAGGSLAAGTEYYQITYVNSQGETAVSATASISRNANELTTVAAPLNPGGSCTGYNVYASSTSGGTYYKQNTSGVIAFGTDFTEASSGLVATGTTAPAGNTATIAGEISAGNGYNIAGSPSGYVLSGLSWGQVLANSWADVWTATSPYVLGQAIRPATGNGNLYLCVTAGTSGASAPTFGTTPYGLTTGDGGVSWMCLPVTSLNVFKAANISLPVTGVIAYRYVVIYDSTTNDLVACFDPLSVQTGPSSGSLNVNWDAAGIAGF